MEFKVGDLVVYKGDRSGWYDTFGGEVGGIYRIRELSGSILELCYPSGKEIGAPYVTDDEVELYASVESQKYMSKDFKIGDMVTYYQLEDDCCGAREGEVYKIGDFSEDCPSVRLETIDGKDFTANLALICNLQPVDTLQVELPNITWEDVAEESSTDSFKLDSEVIESLFESYPEQEISNFLWLSVSYFKQVDNEEIAKAFLRELYNRI